MPTTEELIRQEATKQGVPPELALAIADRESSLNPATPPGPKLPSGEQAIGLFQILPSTAKARGFDPADPYQNLQGGISYIRDLLQKHQGDRDKVIAEYGGVVHDKSYVPSVLARLPKFDDTVSSTTPPLASDTGGTAPSATAAPPAPVAGRGTSAQNIGAVAVPRAKSAISAYDPRTAEGRENWAATAASVGTSLLTEGAGLVPWAVRFLSPGVAGGIEAGAEQLLGTTPPAPGGAVGAAATAAARQTAYEAAGRATMAVPRKVARMVLAKPVAQAAEAELKATYEAARAQAPKVTDTANAVQAVTKMVGEKGAAQKAKDAAGRAIPAAVATGPDISLTPVKDQLRTSAASVKPRSILEKSADTDVRGIGFLKNVRAASAASTGAVTPAERAKFAAFVQQQLGISPEERLPLTGLLDRIQSAPDSVSFQDGHALKMLLDERVNWARSAKSIDERLMKGVRQTLRDQLAVHEPYNQATKAYAAIAPLYDPKQVGGKLIKAAQQNPDALARTLDESRPIAADKIKQLLVNQSEVGGDAAGGVAAWRSVRDQYSYRKLLTGGIENLADRIERMQVEHPEFTATVYGDASGRQILTNYLNIGQAWRAYTESTLAQSEQRLTHQAVDVMHGVVAPHSPGGARAIARTLLSSPSRADFLRWVGASPLRTRLVVRGLLSQSSDAASAALMRAFVRGDAESDNLAADQTNAATAP